MPDARDGRGLSGKKMEKNELLEEIKSD